MNSSLNNFEYLDPNALYFDSACQTLRPNVVIAAQDEYFKYYNSCGERTKYKWGRQVDAHIDECRRGLLRMLDLSEKDYAVAFTLNTTYGINLVLSQLPGEKFAQIVTSEIEHNSVFLPTMTAAKKNSWTRKVLKRNENGDLDYQAGDLEKAVVLVNAASNIDGRKLGNVQQLVDDAHAAGGIVLLDCAQTFGHDFSFLKKTKFDAAFGSSHKMYGPSLGFIIIRKDLIRSMDFTFIGGGTVEDVQKDTYTLFTEDAELHAPLEAGLQNFSGIIGLNAALKWRQDFKPEGHRQDEQQAKVARVLFEGLSENKNLTMISKGQTSVITFYSEKIDSHRMSMFLSEQGIMARSGYFCCHYYLKNLLNLPPLLRFSVGLHNTEQQAKQAVWAIGEILENA